MKTHTLIVVLFGISIIGFFVATKTTNSIGQSDLSAITGYTVEPISTHSSSQEPSLPEHSPSPSRPSSNAEQVSMSDGDLRAIREQIEVWLTEVSGVPKKVRTVRLERFHLYSLCLAYDDYSADPLLLDSLLASAETDDFIRNRLYQILATLDPNLQAEYEPTAVEVLEILHLMRPQIQRERNRFAKSLPEWIPDVTEMIIANEFAKWLESTPIK